MLSERVYCVTIAFKMTEWVGQWICIRFWIKLGTFLHRNYSDDDSEGRSYGQLVIGSFIKTTRSFMHYVLGRVFWQNIKSPRWLSPRRDQIWHSETSGLSQNYNTFEGEEISDHQWDSEKYNRAADGNWENCLRSQGVYFEGDWGVIVLCTMFLVSYLPQ